MSRKYYIISYTIEWIYFLLFLYLRYAWLNENFRKEFKQILPCLFVNISTHRELKNPKNFLNSFSRKKGNENLIKNGERTLQETTFLQANNENVMISIETNTNNHDMNHSENINDANQLSKAANNILTDSNNLVVKRHDDTGSSNSASPSPKTSASRILGTSIS